MWPPYLIATVILLLCGSMIFTHKFSAAPLGISKGRSGFLAALLFVSCFLAFGLNYLFQITQAKKLSADGVIKELGYSGKHTYSNFSVAGTHVTTQLLQSDYEGSHLMNGELVHVDYLSTLGTVTHLQVLSGPYTGWSKDEGDGKIPALLVSGFGLFLILFVYKSWRKYPNGNYPEKSALK